MSSYFLSLSLLLELTFLYEKEVSHCIFIILNTANNCKCLAVFFCKYFIYWYLMEYSISYIRGFSFSFSHILYLRWVSKLRHLYLLGLFSVSHHHPLAGKENVISNLTMEIWYTFILLQEVTCTIIVYQ